MDGKIAGFVRPWAPAARCRVAHGLRARSKSIKGRSPIRPRGRLNYYKPAS